MWLFYWYNINIQLITSKFILISVYYIINTYNILHYLINIYIKIEWRIIL